MCYNLVFPETQVIRYLSNLVKHMYNGNCLEYLICASSEFPKVIGPVYLHWQTNQELFIKHFNFILYGYNFYFEKNIFTGNNFTFNSPLYLQTPERIMALQQMTDEKKHISLIQSVLFSNSCVQFLPKTNFVLGALKIVQLQTKFEK